MTMAIGVITLILCLVLMFVVSKRHKSTKGPRSWPLIGSYVEVLRNFKRLHEWTEGYFEENCKTYTINLGKHSNIVTVDPVNVEYILSKNFANYPKGSYIHDNLSDLLGDGIFTSDGETWRRHRKLASHEFTCRKLKQYGAEVFKEGAMILMQVLQQASEKNREVDFQDLCLRMTMDSFCKIGFGVDLGCLSASLPHVPFADAFDSASEILVRRTIGPFWKLLRMLNLGSERKLSNHLLQLDTFASEVIETKRKHITHEENLVGKEDLLSRFMTAQLLEDSYNSDKQLRDAILNFVLAGRDTTAVSLSWFLYCICNNPTVGDKIAKELDNIVGGDQNMTFNEFGDLLTHDTLSKMHYLHAAITETLRLYPAVAKDSKTAASNDMLPDGTYVKKGDYVSYVPYSMGRMSFLWGSDAKVFKPERWLDVHGHFQSSSPFKFSAFQAGPRLCLGKDFAYTQMKITAAFLLRYFTFNLVPGHIVHYRITMVLAMLHGLKIRVFQK